MRRNECVWRLVPADSPSRGGDVAVYIFDINKPNGPRLFIQFLCLFLSIWPFQLHFIPWILPTTLRFLTLFFRSCFCLTSPRQWRAVDAEIKVPSGENTELKRSPFKAWSRSVYSYIFYAYREGFLPCLILHFQSIHLHFFQTSPDIFPCVGCG